MSSLKSLVNVSHTASPIQHEWGSSGISSYMPFFVTATLFLLVVYSRRESYPAVPRLNPKKPTELTWRARLLDWMGRSAELLEQGDHQFPDQPYMLYTEVGDALFIPPKYVDELKSNRALEFSQSTADDAHGNIPGFAPFTNHHGFLNVVQNYMTKALASLTAPISEEATSTLRDVFTDSQEWHGVTSEDVMILISRMSSRIFMGEELCKDKEWNECSSEYISTAFRAGFELNKWPHALRPLVHWFMADCAEVRRLLQRCRAVLQPHIDRRVAIKAAAAARGEPHPYNDSIEWFSREMRADHDPAAVQITLSLVAIHTTTDLLVQTMIDIARHPEIIATLREEVIEVLSTDGFKKTAFQKLKLMDSCCKESQRIRPILLTCFQRTAQVDVQLKDGFVIKKGTRVRMNGRRAMLDAAAYPEPLRWDPYRFVRMRAAADAEQQRTAHLVSASPQHVGFGHGVHLCPGRFFAANEIKIALAHLLLKYDWKLAAGQDDLRAVPMGSTYSLPHGIKFLVRRRQEELDLGSLEY